MNATKEIEKTMAIYCDAPPEELAHLKSQLRKKVAAKLLAEVEDGRMYAVRCLGFGARHTRDSVGLPTMDYNLAVEVTPVEPQEPGRAEVADALRLLGRDVEGEGA